MAGFGCFCAQARGLFDVRNNVEKHFLYVFADRHAHGFLKFDYVFVHRHKARGFCRILYIPLPGKWVLGASVASRAQIASNHSRNGDVDSWLVASSWLLAVHN
eukprot:3787374-Karenia_brevis.AAC.1